LAPATPAALVDALRPVADATPVLFESLPRSRVENASVVSGGAAPETGKIEAKAG
jgi:hypothetical protein